MAATPRTTSPTLADRNSRSASAATTPSRARRRTGRSTRSSSSRTARCSRASCRPRRASTARSASAARARPPSAARAACASTASPAWPATRISTSAQALVAGRRHRGRADGQHARHQGPDRRHGRGPLEEDPARHAVAHQQGADPRARVHRRRASRWSTSRSRWRASSAAPASRTASRWRSTRCSSARPRWPRPTASSATRATPSSSSASRTSPRTRTASTTARTASSASRPAPRAWRPMNQIMRLRRRAGNDHHIVDRNNGERHETAFVTLIQRQRAAARGRAAAALLRRRLVVRQVPPGARARSCSTRCPRSPRRSCAARSRRWARCSRHKHPQARTSSRSRGSTSKVEGRDERLELNLYITGYDEDIERRRTSRRRGRAGHQPTGEPARPRRSPTHEGRLLARLREPRLHPELHGSMAKIAPLLDIELVELDRAVLHRRRRHRRAQPGARRHAERAHVRARPAGRGRRPDDEHLLDLPGRADRVPGAPRRQRRVPRARQRDAGRGRAEYEKGIDEQELPLGAGRGVRPRQAARARQAAADRPAASARSTAATSSARPTGWASTTSNPRDTYLGLVIEALGGTVIEYAGSHKCCGFPIITMNKEASLKQAGPPPRRRGGRRRRLPRDAVPAVPPQPRPAAAAGRARRWGATLDMPVLHLPQLVGLALGLEPEGARAAAPRRQADRGHRLDDLGRRGRRAGGRRRQRQRRLVGAVPKIRRGAAGGRARRATSRPAAGAARRPDAPPSIIPVVGDGARPSWLPAERDPHRTAARPAGRSLALDLDAARERLRRAIRPSTTSSRCGPPPWCGWPLLGRGRGFPDVQRRPRAGSCCA